ncbi:MAG TPA: pyridoxamine 5'-phosphate oxidase family protein [Burkholderiaceae bacterium]|nr:pyridoxamine 5'-phosphate oxidase family protein [Burkholderiaceae bacterium]
MNTDARSPIGPEQAALIGRRVSIMVGSRDATLRPHLMRAVGCRLSVDWRRATLLVPQGGGREVLDDLRENGRIAVVFSEPSSNRTVQLKGHDATVTTCGPDDAALAERYVQGFVAEIGKLGFGEDLASTILCRDDALLAVHFTIAEAFEQTPGPAAGEPVARPAG